MPNSEEQQNGAETQVSGQQTEGQAVEQTKAEEKKRKKQAAKERTEALARRFEMDDDAAKSADGLSSAAFRGPRRTVPAWEEEGGLYSGIGW